MLKKNKPAIISSPHIIGVAEDGFEAGPEEIYNIEAVEQKLATATRLDRDVELTGDVVGSAHDDGSALTIDTTLNSTISSKLDSKQDKITATSTAAGSHLLTAPTQAGGQPGSLAVSSFATSAQGSKADTALQSVTASNGLTVDSKSGTTQNVKGVDATTSAKGVVQLTDSINSTSVTTAATPNSVKSAYDLANGKQTKSTADYQVGNVSGGWTALTDANKKILATFLPDFLLGQMLYGGTVTGAGVVTLSTNAKTKLGTSSNQITLTIEKPIKYCVIPSPNIIFYVWIKNFEQTQRD